jgi:phosphohistidine phosphatase
MKQLLVLRHAKSDWDDASIKDFDRPLAPRGLRDAPLMGRMAKILDVVPDRIISSPAMRAKQTAEIFAESSGFNGEITYEKKLYGGSPEIYRSIISSNNDAGLLLLIGHNPVIEEFLGLITTGHNSSPIVMPTAGLACLNISNPVIREIYPGSGQLSWFMNPRMLNKIAGNAGSGTASY